MRAGGTQPRGPLLRLFFILPAAFLTADVSAWPGNVNMRFGRTNVGIWRVSIAVELGCGGKVAEIASGSQEQSTGLSQVNAAVNEMDKATQQNAAMAEETTAAAARLRSGTAELQALVARFRTQEAGAPDGPSRRLRGMVPAGPEERLALAG